MDPNDAADIRRMQALVDLRDKLALLSAQLEYVRLMLRIRRGGGAGSAPG